jgi:DNA polymerase-3 subunit delta'
VTWERIRGHDSVRDQLLAAEAHGRLGHAFLFAGPPGVGKRLFADEFAKALLCENPPAPLTACGRCPACQQVAAGSHPDVAVARTPEDKHELPVEVVRALCRKLGLKPSRGKRSVGIVEDADDFNEESANCFLKTLEEPAPGSVLILLTTGTERQLPTILSRCQVVRFRPLSEFDMRAVLTTQGITDAATLDRLSRLGNGAPGQALDLADDALWQFRDVAIQAVGSNRADAVSLSAKWMDFVEAAGKESSQQRARASQSIRLLIDFYREVLRHAVSPDDANASGDPRAGVLARRTDPDGVAGWLEACDHAHYLIERKVQLVLVVESLADKLCATA